MSYKYVVAVAIGWVALCTQAILTDLKPDNPYEKAIKDVVKEIQGIVDKDIEQLTIACETALKNINIAGDSFPDSAEVIMQPSIDDILDYSIEAAFAGVDVTECEIEESLANLGDTVLIYFTELKNYLNDTQENVNRTLEGGIEELDNILAEVQELETEASKCGPITSRCWVKLAKKAERNKLTVPPRIQKVWGAIWASFRSLEQSAWQRKLDYTYKIAHETDEITRRVLDCIENKINSAQTETTNFASTTEFTINRNI